MHRTVISSVDKDKQCWVFKTLGLDPYLPGSSQCITSLSKIYWIIMKNWINIDLSEHLIIIHPF